MLQLQNQQEESQLPTKLQLPFGVKYIHGYRSDFKNNIFQLSEQRVVYPASNSVIVNNSENKQQFYHTYSGTSGITCMAQSVSKKYIAWAEEYESGIIIIQDMTKPEKRKTITSQDCKARAYVCLDFHKTDEKLLIALSGQPDWQLIYFQWDKQKVISSVSLKIVENMRYSFCFFHPKEDDFIGLVGHAAIKSYKLGSDGQLKQKDSPFIKKDSKDLHHSTNYTSYCLLPDQNMIIGTDQGELLFFQSSFEFKTILPTSPKNEQMSIECIQTYSKGFIVAGSDCTILMYEKCDNDLKNPYIRADKKIQLKEFKTKITSLLVTNGEEKLIVGIEGGQLLQILFSPENQTISEENSKCEPLYMSYHSQKVKRYYIFDILYFYQKKITGLDVCIRKALVVTCSFDRYVKIWNYIDNTLENSKLFDEEAYSVAIHPSGFHIIVGFADRIKFLNIFENDLISFKELTVKNCREIQFSNGGHLFAITNITTVQVFDFYTGEMASHLAFRGSGKVKSIFWEQDDQGFFTGNTDGIIYYWRVDDAGPQKTQIATFPGMNITCITGHQSTENNLQHVERIIFVSGVYSDENNLEDNIYGNQQQLQQIQNSEKCVYKITIHSKLEKENRELSDGNLKKKFIVAGTQKIFTGSDISQVALAHCNKLFFFTTEDKGKPGAIRVMKYPFTNEILELQSHVSSITRLRVSFDDNYVFTASEDGALIIYKNEDKEFKVKMDKDNIIETQFTEEFLIQREQYNNQKNEIERLKKQLNEEKQRQDLQIKESLKILDMKILELEQVKNQNQERDLQEIKKQQSEIEEMNENYEKQKQMLKNLHQQNKKTIENECKKKIALEMQRNEELQREKEKEERNFKQDIHSIENDHKREMAKKTAMYEQQLADEKQQYADLHAKSEQLKIEFEKTLNQLELSAENQIDKLKELNETRMQELFNTLEKSEIKKMEKRNDYDTESQKLEDQKSKLKGTMEEITSIQETNKMLQKEKETHTKEIDEREKAIKDKGRRIYELKKKTQELEKFKFVLDYKIKELKRDKGPKEEEIAKMKEQIANMNSEILHFNRTNNNLLLIVSDLKLRQKGMKKELEKQNQQINSYQQYINAFEQDMSSCYSNINDQKKLKQSIVSLLNQYVQNDDFKFKKSENNDFQREIMKERSHLETSVTNLKLKHDKNQQVHKSDTEIIMKHNTFLIFEINHLRREQKDIIDDKIKLMNVQRKKKENSLNQIEKEIQYYDEKKLKLQKEIQNQRQINDQIKSKFLIQNFIFNIKIIFKRQLKIKMIELIKKNKKIKCLLYLQ
ncbi:WD repeat protein [Ichthyophthirius multifiliis]|uniref:WD repeat protein n=1 Tax=Ichthyophthirius multifiliis TaxID=5932 RepID=G0QSH3_ICHMU|nr:WD repeat protein [Ichthyophthirius multifiliis]EGR31811.1 WD repeat protein [Ichthyophthirius multifiliis]|eukprot:XP_004035297.1 WD repeat protein [Ichthyophthirius multifiliis]